jgi:hypothetical protein
MNTVASLESTTLTHIYYVWWLDCVVVGLQALYKINDIIRQARSLWTSLCLNSTLYHGFCQLKQDEIKLVRWNLLVISTTLTEKEGLIWNMYLIMFECWCWMDDQFKPTINTLLYRTPLTFPGFYSSWHFIVEYIRHFPVCICRINFKILCTLLRLSIF